MRISPAGIGKIAGVVVCVAVIAIWLLWSRTEYSVRGTVQVDTGAYVSPGANIDVHLILASVDEDVKKLVAEFAQLRASRISQSVVTLVAETAPVAPESAAAADPFGLSLEHVISDSLKDSPSATAAKKLPVNNQLVQSLKEPPSQEEKDEISLRIQEYLEYAMVCRDSMESCPVGKNFYLKGAEYWEKKASDLQEKGRLVYDEATPNYSTVWETFSGLSQAPVQYVIREIRVDPTLLNQVDKQLAGVGEKPVPEKKKEPAKKLQIADVPTNEIMAVAVELERVLKERNQYVITETAKLLQEKILYTKQTDSDGSYVFNGADVLPGTYVVFTQYDVLSAEGEPVEFMWYCPVTVPLSRMALKKTVAMNLNELNQSKPATLEMYIPEQGELYLQLIDEIQKKQSPKKEIRLKPAV
jgi:hypothetical protein